MACSTTGICVPFKSNTGSGWTFRSLEAPSAFCRQFQETIQVSKARDWGDSNPVPNAARQLLAPLDRACKSRKVVWRPEDAYKMLSKNKLHGMCESSQNSVYPIFAGTNVIAICVYKCGRIWIGIGYYSFHIDVLLSWKQIAISATFTIKKLSLTGVSRTDYGCVASFSFKTR